jgi:predicted XRE-type DNA-binding protein
MEKKEGTKMKENPKKEVISVRLDDSQFRSLVGAVEKLAKAFAVAQIKDNQDTNQKARFLRVFGFTQQEISDILGITQPAVSQALAGKKGIQRGSGNDTISET